MSDDYLKAIKMDADITNGYYLKSVNKTEQQKYLEKLIGRVYAEKYNVADVACGGGTLSYHLKEVFPNSNFYLYDYNDQAIAVAKELNKENSRFNYFIGNIYKLTVEDNFFDFTFCWQTLSWLDNPEKALGELIRITKPHGKIYLSSLFNLDHDVDIYAKVIDHTRESGRHSISSNYNTYSLHSINNWLKDKVLSFYIHKFMIDVDLPLPSPPIVALVHLQKS
jgi:ubiquinone/menaquinone biosynthesis C-methylase UbiE